MNLIMASPLTKITTNYQVTIPLSVRTALGLKRGDVLEAVPYKRGVLLRPKVVVVRDAFDERLQQDVEAGLADVRAGRILGSFEDAHAAARAFQRKYRLRARRHK